MSNLEIPRGLRDMLPNEVRTRRLMEKRLADLFSSYGYEEVITPTFEFMEVVEEGTGGNIREQLFLFMDREGGILSLRPEMTTSIARLAATHLRNEHFPRRLYYLANVFRHVQPQLAQYREFWQMGVELLGAAGPWADAEVISLAVKAMQKLGVNNFKVSINQIGIFNSILEDKAISTYARAEIRRLVENKDLVELSAILESLPIADGLKDTIARLPVLHGGLEVIDKIPYVNTNRKAALAVAELLQVYDALKAFGVQDHIVIDMGVLRGLDYYTGVEFEGYSPDLGYGLLGGGRYDRLLGKFGFDCPATGFALGMDRLALVAGQLEEKGFHYVVGGTNYQAMAQKADELRAQGNVAELALGSGSKEELEEKLKSRKNCILVYV
jgi:ATP phosphoribosyltransferase regulatory subunit